MNRDHTAISVDPVSVVMATYNGERFLSMQVESILADLKLQDELVIVDDASSDKTIDILRAVADPRICIVPRKINQGVRRTFEEAIRRASNEIIFLCDQDDIWLPGKRSAFLAAFAESPRCIVVISDAQVIGAEGAIVAQSFMKTRGGFRSNFFSTLMRNRYLGCAMAIRRSLLSTALPIPDSVPMHDMWLGSVGSLIGDVIYLPTPYIQYRRHDANLSPARRQSFARMLKWRIMMLLLISRRFVFGR